MNSPSNPNPSDRPLSHELRNILRRPPHLRKRKTPLDALQKLARHLVAHDMAPLTRVQLLARASLVDTHHGHADGPRRLADAEPEVAVVGVDVAPFLRRLDDFDDGFEDGVFEFAFFELFEELWGLVLVLGFGRGGKWSVRTLTHRLHVLPRLHHGIVRRLARQRIPPLLLHRLLIL